MFERFTDPARRVVVLAQEEARALGHANIGTEHLLLGLLRIDDPALGSVFEAAGIDYAAAAGAVAELFAARPVAAGAVVPFTPAAKKVLELALREALQLGHNHIGPEHLLLGLLRDDSPATAAVFDKLGQNPVELRGAVLRRIAHGAAATAPVTDDRFGMPAPKSALESFGRNLTAAANDGKLDPVVGRDRELLRIMQVLTRRTKNNPVLIGEPGVGKTAVIEALAARIATGDVPRALMNKQLWALDLGSMVAGSRYRGDFEERFKKLLTEATERDDVLLFLDELHTVIGAGNAEGGLDAASMLKPLLARGELRLIGATTIDEYRRIEKDAALERRFAPITIDAPSVAETVVILRGLREHYEAHHSVTISDDALEAAARLSARFLPDRRLPDKAIDLLDEAASRLRLVQDLPQVDLDGIVARIEQTRAAQTTARTERHVQRVAELAEEITRLENEWKHLRDLVASGETDHVGAAQVAEALAAWTGIPVTQLAANESNALANLDANLARRVIGQPDAVSAVSRAVRRTRAGVRDPHRPAGSFLFLGPTGVGKTELAKALAEQLFGSADAMIRLDMGEFQEAHTVARLVGAPPGYVGFDDGGQLTEAVRRKPWSVVLFDEVEKAHPDVFNALLQVLDDGRLTDAQGRTVDFRNTIVVMTSNLGSSELTKSTLGFAHDSSDARAARNAAAVNDALKKHFRPEFLNRIDDTVVFRPLDAGDIAVIVDKFAAELTARLVAQGLELELTASARAKLAADGFDPAYGARPLRRVFSRLIEDPVAEGIVAGTYRPGDHIVADTEVGADGASVIGFRVAVADPVIENLTN